MMKFNAVRYGTLDTPIGELLLSTDGTSLTGVYMEVHKHGPERDERWRRDDDSVKDAAEQLSSYFRGERTDFQLALRFPGTEFQEKVWNALLDIPFGETISYSELAHRIGSPKAVRAVGAAVGRNPISIIVPCHRVVGSNGSLTGFGGGLPRKKWLLDHERTVRAGSTHSEDAGELPLFRNHQRLQKV
jgi:methylated-DNA-[protein]-cysteine S-methyltransferase